MSDAPSSDDFQQDEDGPIRIVEGPYRLDESCFQGFVCRAGVSFVVFFHVPWASPCIQLAPFIDQLATLSEGRFLVGTANVERFPSLAADQGVDVVPSIILYKDGKEIDRIETGNTSLPRIRKMIREHLGTGPQTKPLGRQRKAKKDAKT